jgi:hypothetical protein
MPRRSQPHPVRIDYVRLAVVGELLDFAFVEIRSTSPPSIPFGFPGKLMTLLIS